MFGADALTFRSDLSLMPRKISSVLLVSPTPSSFGSRHEPRPVPAVSLGVTIVYQDIKRDQDLRASVRRQIA
jgi:hypothetical protein